MSTANIYKSMLRPRDQRQAFRKNSQTNYTEHDALRADTMSTQTADISMEHSLFVDHSTRGSDSSLSNLKEYIKLQFLQVHTEIQMLKEGKSNKKYKDASSQTDIRVDERGVLAECETFTTATKQPYALTGGIDSEGVYVNTDADFKSRPHFMSSTNNPVYEAVHIDSSDRIPNVDSARVKQHRNVYDNVTLVPKRIEELQQFRSNSLQTRVKTAGIVCRTKSDVPVIQATYDERECLANALQFQIEVLVDGLIFHESELPDCLLVEGCLTEDECSTVRKLRDRKDQIRILLSIIKGRDLRVLKGFMKHIEQHNPDVAGKITETYERNKREGLRGNLCVRCKLEKQFNIKNVVDSLWAIQAIEDGLYSEIIISDTPVGAQGTLWKKMFSSLSCLDPVNADKAYIKLLNAISNKNMFTHLVQGISNMLIKNHGKLTCSCEPRYSFQNTLSSSSTSGESWIPGSSSDGTSNDLLSFEGTEYGSLEVGNNAKPGDILFGKNGKMEHMPPHFTTITGPETRYKTQYDEITIPKTTAPDVIPLPCTMRTKSASPEDILHEGFMTLHKEATSIGCSPAPTRPSPPNKVALNNIPTVLIQKPSVPKKPNWSGTARN